MRVFVTGSTGFIGSRVTAELIAAGHQVLGLTRSEAGAQALAALGAQACDGHLEDLEGLARGAAQCDGVIHTAFDHDFAHFVENCEKDRRAIMALGSALEGSERPLIITSGTAMGARAAGQLATEDYFDLHSRHPRAACEHAGNALLQRGVNVSVMRLSQIHDRVKQGLVTYTIALARQKGVSAYCGEGTNAWSAAAVSDVTRLYRLALEKALPGARYHGVAEQGIAFKDIAQTLGDTLGLPVTSLSPQEADAHFGWLAGFVGSDMSASSALTRAALGWHPTGPGLLEDLAHLQG